MAEMGNKNNLDNGKAEKPIDTELLNKIEVSGTPFTIVNNNDGKGWFILMGKYNISGNGYESQEDAFENASKIDWDKILQVIQILIRELSHE